MFIERTATALGDLMSRRLDDVRMAVMMLDGLEIADRTHAAALGISTDGVKIPFGLWQGSTENATLARALLPSSSTAAWTPSRRSCSSSTAARRSGARSTTSSAGTLATQRLELLAAELDRTWPDAAASLREGRHDMLTLMPLAITGQLPITLCSTNPCRSMIEIVRYTQRNGQR